MFYPMSNVESPHWIGEKSALKSKYEKCQDITSEIYKRIDITFEIKKLESNIASDVTNDIDSNELSNGTDLFAYEKTDSLSSSVTLDDYLKPPRKIINLNNNEEMLKRPKIKRRAKKRFRKRIKKKLLKTVESDCSSDEEPLSRIVVNIKKLDQFAKTPTICDDTKKPKKLVKIRKSKHKFKKKKKTKLLSENSTITASNAVNATSEDEQLNERTAREYDYFAKIMETVSDASDLDAVMLPAFYPKVDLYEKKLGLTSDNVTYYTFAGLLEAAGSASELSVKNNMENNHPVGSSLDRENITSDIDLVINTPEILEKNISPVNLSFRDGENSIPVSECHTTLNLETKCHTDISTDVIKTDPEIPKEYNSDQKSHIDVASSSKCCEEINLQLKNYIDLSVQSFIDPNTKEKSVNLESECHIIVNPTSKSDSKVSSDVKISESHRSDESKCHKVDLNLDDASEPVDLCVVGYDASENGGGACARTKKSKVGGRRQCQFCKISFGGDGGFRKHLKSCCFSRSAETASETAKTPEKKYACNECEGRYTQRSTLRVHALAHRGEGPHRCHACHKSFTRYNTWKRHQRVHSKPQPHD